MLVSVLIVLAIIGLILWAIGRVPGLPEIVKVIIYVVVGIIILLWLLHFVQGGGLHTGHWR
ncbi:MAG: Thivi_2564 family membrane protein [Chloroflexota bacterium]